MWFLHSGLHRVPPFLEQERRETPTQECSRQPYERDVVMSRHELQHPSPTCEQIIDAWLPGVGKVCTLKLLNLGVSQQHPNINIKWNPQNLVLIIISF